MRKFGGFCGWFWFSLFLFPFFLFFSLSFFSLFLLSGAAARKLPFYGKLTQLSAFQQIGQISKSPGSLFHRHDHGSPTPTPPTPLGTMNQSLFAYHRSASKRITRKISTHRSLPTLGGRDHPRPITSLVHHLHFWRSHVHSRQRPPLRYATGTAHGNGGVGRGTRDCVSTRCIGCARRSRNRMNTSWPTCS